MRPQTRSQAAHIGTRRTPTPGAAPRSEQDHPSWNRSRGFTATASGGRKRHIQPAS